MTRNNEPGVASIWELFDEAGPNPLGGIANQTLHSFRRVAPANSPPPESLLSRSRIPGTIVEPDQATCLSSMKIR